jgi:hypothetical protein
MATKNHLYGGLLGMSAPQGNALKLGALLGGKPRLEEALPLPNRKALDTKLNPLEEMIYRQWMQQIGHTRDKGFAVDDNFTGENYDYRGYFRKYGPVKLGEQDHLTDEYKHPSHPSFSNESIYGQPGTPGAPYAGSWQGETYTPSLVRYIQSLRRPK